MGKYIMQLSENDVLNLGKKLTGKSSTRVKGYKIDNAKLSVNYRVDCNAPKGTSVLERSKIYSIDAVVGDFGIEGQLNTFYPLNTERYFERFVSYMVGRFGKEYAQELYAYHKSLIENIEQISIELAKAGDAAKENPSVANYFHMKATNMHVDYRLKLKNLQKIIQENLQSEDRLEV